MALGYPHPDYLLPLLTSEQLSEWQAYALLEPFVEKNRDFSLGILGHAVAQFSQMKSSKKLTPQDFMLPEFKPTELVNKMHHKEIKSFFVALSNKRKKERNG